MGGEELYYNVSSVDYYNDNKRNTAIKRIAEEMDIGITFSPSEGYCEKSAHILFEGT